MTVQYTPAMQQYVNIKKEHPDCLLFFRIGDFYETFFEDAKIAAKILDLLITSKNKNAEDPIPMAGIPHHSIDKYIPKLVAHGYKVAIAEQTSEPVAGKLVEREVTQIITPATFIQEGKAQTTSIVAVTLLEQSEGNFHLAWGDFSLGEYWTKSFHSIEDLGKHIVLLRPVECIVDSLFPQKDDLIAMIHRSITCQISLADIPHRPQEYLMEQCRVQTLASYGKAAEHARGSALALLFGYLQSTQKKNLTNISRISYEGSDHRVLLDEVTVKNLELLSSSYEGSNKYSLFGILDSTASAGGSRLLEHILLHPSNDQKELEKRLGHIQWFLDHDQEAETTHATLKQLVDIPKIMSILLYKKLSALGFAKLRSTLEIALDPLLPVAEGLEMIGISGQETAKVREFAKILHDTIKDDEDIDDELNFIRDGVDSEIDRLRVTAFHSDNLLLDYQQELATLSGVNNIKVKYILNQGYFIEITNKDIEAFERKFASLPEAGEKYQLLRRNTLKGGQRYTSPYLDGLQGAILDAKMQLMKLEYSRIAHLQQHMGMIVKELNDFASGLARLDVFSSQALLAFRKSYVRPSFLTHGTLHIVGGRHPVIEKFLPLDQQFIPNDLNISTKEESDYIHIITGPNMGGKSTYLRQNALIVLMAHCGLFVPAKQAEIGLVDAIFARVGSGDVIAKNQSTFMTEMIEVANIINNASAQSFIIFDELGRGTSTYDGLALTRSILEYIATTVKARTLIATHYHELIELEEHFPQVHNYSVSVYETSKEVVFLKKIVAGGASKSYGLDVAKLAGLPPAIIAQAREYLRSFEHHKAAETTANTGFFSAPIAAPTEDPNFSKLKAMLESYDINSMTPLQALQLLSKMKEIL